MQSVSTKIPAFPPFVTDDVGFINCDDEDDCNEKFKETTGIFSMSIYIFIYIHIILSKTTTFD